LKTANLLDLVIVVLYMLAMVSIGFVFMRFNKGASDYFKGGNRIPWLVAALSCFMSGFSAWTFTGAMRWPSCWAISSSPSVGAELAFPPPWLTWWNASTRPPARPSP
jgi:hypothetical protein